MKNNENILNRISASTDIHGLEKYKLLSQAFNEAISSNDVQLLVELVHEFQKEVDFGIDEKSRPSRNLSEAQLAVRRDINIKAREERTKKQKESRTSVCVDFWKRYTNRSFELFDGSPVRLFPYIGNKYFSSPVKVLWLGESHYKKAKSDGSKPDLGWDTSIDVFLGSYQWNNWQFRNDSFAESIKYIDVPSYCRCYRKVAAMMSGCYISDADYVCDNIAFYNYFQCAVGDGWKQFRDDWVTEEERKIAGEALFDGVLPKLQPDIVIVWGERLGSSLRKFRTPDGVVDARLKSQGSFYSYKSGGKDILFFQIPHPSSFGKGGFQKDPCQEKWGIVKEVYPALEDVIARNLERVGIVEKLCKDIGNTPGFDRNVFNHFFSECSYLCRLFPIENGVANGSSDKVMLLELIFDDNMNGKIRFCTKDYKEETARSVLSHSAWMLTEDVLESSDNGRFTLQEFPCGTSIETFMNSLLGYMQKMKDCRNSI